MRRVKIKLKYKNIIVSYINERVHACTHFDRKAAKEL